MDTECLASLYFHGMHLRRNQIGPAQPNTYEWIWEHSRYNKWFSTEDGERSSMLWIQGKPECGKSTLARMVRISLAPGGIHDESYTTADSEVYGSNTGLKPDWRSTVYDGVSRDICADYFYSSRGVSMIEVTNGCCKHFSTRFWHKIQRC